MWQDGRAVQGLGPCTGCRCRHLIPFTRIVRHVPAGEGNYSSWPLSPSTRQPGSTRVPNAPPSTRSTCTSRTASSSSSSARPAAASRPRCACSPASRTSTAVASSSGDRDVTDVQPKDRDIAMVFQNYALYPHMSVADNMGFALKIAGTPKAEIRSARRGGSEDPRPDRVPGPQAEGPLRWPASARRHGPRHRASAPGVPHGRAAVEPRRQAPRADAYADRLAPAPSRRHHGLRHARPDRGPHHG